MKTLKIKLKVKYFKNILSLAFYDSSLEFVAVSVITDILGQASNKHLLVRYHNRNIGLIINSCFNKTHKTHFLNNK